MEVIEQESADTLRYWATSVKMGNDTPFNLETTANGRRLVTKLWNASRFAQGRLEGFALQTDSGTMPDTLLPTDHLQTGIEAWWDIGQGDPPPNEPVRPLIMNQTPNRDSPQKGWGVGLYFPQAGCYAMQASWPGGQWRLLFAVGR